MTLANFRSLFTPLTLVNIIVTLWCCLSQLPILQPWLVWDKDLIAAGEVWRLISGNFTHTNLTHLAMDLSAFWLISYFFNPNAKTQLWLLFIGSLCIGLSLMWSSISIYLGLSGVLHTLFAYGALKECLEGRKLSFLFLFGLVFKLFSEQHNGTSAFTANLINARVATEAHLSGALIGLLLAAICWSFKHFSILRSK